MGVAINAARLVVVLPVQSIPAAIVVHEGLPCLEEGLQVGELPVTGLELVVLSVVDVDMLEVEDHVDLAPIVAYSLQHLVRVLDERHFAHAERIVLLQDLAQVLQIFVQARPVGVEFVRPLPDAARVFDGRVREGLVLADEVDHVHAEPVGPLVEPETHDVVHCLADRRVLPVEVWLLRCVEMEVVFAGQLVILPCAACNESDSPIDSIKLGPTYPGNAKSSYSADVCSRAHQTWAASRRTSCGTRCPWSCGTA